MVSKVGLKATSFNDGSRYAPVITASWKIEASKRANYLPVNYRQNIDDEMQINMMEWNVSLYRTSLFFFI